MTFFGGIVNHPRVTAGSMSSRAAVCDSRSTYALIATLALSSPGCTVQQQASSSEWLLHTEATIRVAVWQQVVVAAHDTLRELTTITLQQNDQGDTNELVQVIDRIHASRSLDLREKKGTNGTKD